VITLDDSDGSEQIKIMDKTQKNMIIIDTKNNKISIKSDKDIELSAPNGKVTIEAMDIVTKSTASTKIEATSSVDVKASGNLNIKGAMVNIN